MFGKGFKPKTTKADYGWHSRRKLPHLDAECSAQFVTFRLFDSLPQDVIEKWRAEITDEAKFRKSIEKYLDSGSGECWLRHAEVAMLIANALKFHDGKKYRLHAWVIMPNHVHILLTLMEGEHLPEIMHSIKSYTAQYANKILGRKGQFWQHESFIATSATGVIFTRLFDILRKILLRLDFVKRRKIGNTEALL